MHVPFFLFHHVHSLRKTHPPCQKSQDQTNPPTIPPHPSMENLLTHHTYPLRRNPSTKNPRGNPAMVRPPPTRPLPVQHFLQTSSTLGSLRRFMATGRRSTMRAVQRARVKERGRLLQRQLLLVVAVGVGVVGVVGYKQPHLGCLQVSFIQK